MLQENKTGSVVSVKLSSAEEVIGRVVSQSDSELELENPMSIAHMAGPNGEMNIHPVPFLTTVDHSKKHTVFIKMSHVVATAKPGANIAQLYSQANSAKKSKIIS